MRIHISVWFLILAAATAHGEKPAITPENSRPQVASKRDNAFIEIPGQTERAWTDFNGRRKSTAILIAANAQTARFRRPNGTEVAAAVARLSLADQKHVMDALRAGRDAPAAKSLFNGALAWLDPFGAKKPQGDHAQDAAPEPRPANIVYVRLSEPLLRRFVGRGVARHTQVTENILGTSIFGTASTTGRIELTLIPDAGRARADLLLRGTSNSTTTGYNGPVVINSQGTTHFASRKALWLDEEGVHSTPARTNAITNSRTTGISTHLPGLRRRIVLNVASRRIAASRARANAIAGERAATRIGNEWDQALDRQLTELTASITGQFKSIVTEPRSVPIRVEYSTTSDYLQLVVFRGQPPTETIAPAPRWAANRPDVEVQVHSSLVRNSVIRSRLPGLLRSVANSFFSEDMMKTALAEPIPNGTAKWHVQSAPDEPWITLVWRRPSAGGSQGTHVADRR